MRNLSSVFATMACDDLELRKIYQVITDPVAAADGYIRIIDDSGEDYLYPGDYFVPIELPTATAKVLATRSSGRGKPWD